MTSDNEKVLVIGDGGWGTAVAMLLNDAGAKVVVWSYDAQYAQEVNRSHINHKFLPGHTLSAGIKFTGDARDAFNGASLVVAAYPTKFARAVYESLSQFYNGAPVVIASKGIEPDSFKTGTAIVRELWNPGAFAALSGPSHAEEVAKRLPTTVVVAGPDSDFIRKVQRLFSTPYFRVYTNPDLLGVELGGPLKNVLAIAAGISDGLDLGDNAKSALITRGMVEMRRFGVALGAKPETFSGLAGIGDLITTCFSPFGRNRRVGMQLAAGMTLKEITASTEMVAEGVETTRAVVGLAKKLNVQMPICESVYEVLFNGGDPAQCAMDLMARSLRSEIETLE